MAHFRTSSLDQHHPATLTMLSPRAYCSEVTREPPNLSKGTRSTRTPQSRGHVCTATEAAQSWRDSTVVTACRTNVTAGPGHRPRDEGDTVSGVEKTCRKAERQLLAKAFIGIAALCPVSGCAGRQAAPTAASACARMLEITVPASAIALPTAGAVVTSATEVPAADSPGKSPLPAYCRVLGSIMPVDASAPPIKFELDLPVEWNRKALMLGGGGFDGTIPYTAGNVPAGPSDRPVPLARGYAVFAGDSGHQSPMQAPLKSAMDASFALNPESLRNYTGDALKKTHDAAVFLIRRRYAVSDVQRLYFAGGSTGGREALQAVLRWPQDWDGAISWFPPWNHVSLVMQVGRVARALTVPGAWPNPTKRKLLFGAVLGVCDGLDGVADGIVSNVSACNARFDPDTALVEGRPLRCRGGADLGDACLSDAQLQVLRVLNTSIAFNPPLASGETHYPGYNVYGADLGMAGDNPWQPLVTALALGTQSPGTPLIAGLSPCANVFWDQWVRYVFAGDEHYDPLSVDPVTRGALRARIDRLSESLDVTGTDFSAFAGRGGKILIAHGTADVLVSTRSTEEYVARIQATMGAAKVREFLRYYEVPGFGHGVSTVFNASWDSLTELDDWVENGAAPPPQVVADSVGVPGRTRPLCEYPSWPDYRGAGDVNAASSFVCVQR